MKFAILAYVAAVVLPGNGPLWADPAIRIEHPAPWGPGGDGPTASISGSVAAAPPGAAVVVLCFAGGVWWVQPRADRYHTAIRGSAWSTPTHLGEQYAALLVRSDAYQIGASVAQLPRVGGEVLAVDIAPGLRAGAAGVPARVKSSSGSSAPAIHIDHPARWGPGGEGPMDSISGSVTAAPAAATVVVLCFAGGVWWVQPYTANYHTPIGDSAWSTSTHLGEQYAALLVRSNAYQIGATVHQLPPVGGDVLARDIVPGRR